MLAFYNQRSKAELVARRFLAPPIKVLLSDDWPGQASRIIGRGVIGRYYEPLPEPVRRKLIQRAAAEMDTTTEAVAADPELVFGPAFQSAQNDSGARERMNAFRNQYGLNRNMAFTALTLVISWR